MNRRTTSPVRATRRVLLTAIVVAASCATHVSAFADEESDQKPTTSAPALTSLADSNKAFVDHFNRNVNKLRIVALFSPT